MMKNKLKCKRIVTAICLLVMVGILCILSSMTVFASSGQDADSVLNVTFGNGNGEISGSLRILLTLTLISIAPTLLIMMTSFTRIIIVLHFTRAALNTQTAPPNQVLVGLALILTFFIMEPTITQINEQAYQPYASSRENAVRMTAPVTVNSKNSSSRTGLKQKMHSTSRP